MFLTIFVESTLLQAEIEKVIVTWSAMECEAICTSQLEQKFAKIAGVDQVIMNKAAGQVELKWKKNAAFSFSPINIAMELIGLTINDIRIRVTGTLKHTDHKVTLISSGDNTQFDLLNPIVPNVHGQATQFNIVARGLEPELRKKLLDAEAQRKIATVEGPLLMPERSPPLELVVSQVSFSEPKQVSFSEPKILYRISSLNTYKRTLQK